MQADIWVTYARSTLNANYFPATDSTCVGGFFRSVNGRETTPANNIGEALTNFINEMFGDRNSARVKTAAAEPAAANYGYHGHDEDVTGYPGVAITATGLLSIVGGDKSDVEDTALFEVSLRCPQTWRLPCVRHHTLCNGVSDTLPHSVADICCLQVTPIFYVGTSSGFTGIGAPPANAPFVRPGHLQIQFTKEGGPHGSGY